MNTIRASIDLDGCLYPWSEGVREALIEHHGRTELADVDMDGTQWDHVKQVIGDEHWEWIFTAEGGMATLNRPHLHYPGVPEALHELAAVADVSFITHRSPLCAAATALWLASHGAPFTSLHVIGRSDRNHGAKSDVEPQADLYVEDNVDNVMELLQNTEAVVMAPRRPYNTGLNGVIASGFFMYDHIDEVVAKARELSGA